MMKIYNRFSNTSNDLVPFDLGTEGKQSNVIYMICKSSKINEM